MSTPAGTPPGPATARTWREFDKLMRDAVEKATRALEDSSRRCREAMRKFEKAWRESVRRG